MENLLLLLLMVDVLKFLLVQYIESIRMLIHTHVQQVLVVVGMLCVFQVTTIQLFLVNMIQKPLDLVLILLLGLEKPTIYLNCLLNTKGVDIIVLQEEPNL